MWNLHNEGDIKQLTRRIHGVISFPQQSQSLHILGAKARLTPEPVQPVLKANPTGVKMYPPVTPFTVVPDTPPLSEEEEEQPVSSPMSLATSYGYTQNDEDAAMAAAEEIEKEWSKGERNKFNWDPMDDDSDDLDLSCLSDKYF